MFESLKMLPDDPILGLIAEFAQETNPSKVDLGPGVYKNELGEVPIVEAVKTAERQYLEEQTTKAYLGIVGDAEFNQHIEKLIYGEQHPILSSKRVRTLQTPGSCGGLFLAANLIKQSKPKANIWVSDPTWGNHYTIFEGAGLNVKAYPYYQTGEDGIRFDEMITTLSHNAQAGDAVLIHGCCHNPTGADLNQEQWHQLGELLLEKNLLPLIDQAYQGYSQGFEEDAYGIAHLAKHLPEMLVSYSCSKSFTVYRERTGALSMIAQNNGQADTTFSQIKQAARASYSMPPNWGANLVKRVLNSEELTQQWRTELSEMRERIINMRHFLADKLTNNGSNFDTAYLKNQNGMFSFLPLSVQQIQQLKQDYGIYLVDSGRVSFPGLTMSNIDYVAEAIAKVSND